MQINLRYLLAICPGQSNKNEGERSLNQSNFDSFIEQVAKNKCSDNNGNCH